MYFMAAFFASSNLFASAFMENQSIDKTVISLEISDASLIKVFKEIEKKTPFYFMYNKNDVSKINHLDIPSGKKTVKAYLDDILIDTRLEYEQMGNHILVKLRTVQDKVVTGTVTDMDGVPIPGVNILLKGSSVGVISDFDGNYAISVPNQGVLVFSYLGYLTKEVPVGSSDVVNVSMEEALTNLNEVTVTAFGVKKLKRSVSYSTQSVDIDGLAEAREINVVNSLQGKVAGVRINESGTGLGAESRVILRGNRSISGDSQPLYVVDGVPINGGISSMSPDNIVSINVLKGPNAAALYGSQAQNGVIIIETRRGEAGKMNVRVNSTVMMGNPIFLFETQNEYGQGVSGVYNSTSEESWGPRMEGQLVDFWSPDPATAGQQYAFLPQPDNFKGIFETAFNVSSGINISGGSEKTQTAFSYTRTDAEGLMPNTRLGRHNLTLRLNNKLTDKISLDAKVSYMKQGNDNTNTTGDSQHTNPYRNIYRMPRNIRDADFRNYFYETVDGSKRQNYFNPGSTSGKNPYWIMNEVLNFVDSNRLNLLLAVNFDITDDLNLIARTAYDERNSSNETKVSEDTYGSAYNFGYYGVSKSNSSLWNSDLILSYNKDLSETISLDVQAGGILRKTAGLGALSANTTQSLLISNFFALSNTLFPNASFNPSNETETQSLFFSGNFGWKRALYLSVTGRNDWSSTLPSHNRSYFYPSVGVSAVLSDLMPSLKGALSFAKVRASWAKVGNSAPPYMLSRTANISSGGNNGFIQLSGTLPNVDLKPETTESVELGLDLRFFNDRLGLDLTYYKTNTFDQLFSVALPTGSGASSFFTNGGDVENKGYEAMLTLVPVRTNDFNWDIVTNFATNRNWVNSISDQRPRVVVGSDSYVREFVVEQGEEFGNIYSRGWERDDQGRVIVGSNGVPLITSGRTVKVANFNPDWTGSIANTFTYKNFSASFLIEHRQGGSYVSMTDAVLNGEGVSKETLEGRDGGLVFGQNLFAGETAVLEDGTPNNISISSQDFWRSVGGRNTPVGEAFVEDATNARLREATLGYSLPSKLMEKLPFSNMKVSLVGRNLFFITKKGNWDPEVLTATNSTAAGFQSFVPPTQRSFGFNLTIDF